jgi:hypothetical protein
MKRMYYAWNNFDLMEKFIKHIGINSFYILRFIHRK